MFAFLRCVDVLHGSSHTTPLLLSRDVSGYTEPKVLGQEQPHRVAFGGEFLYSVASLSSVDQGPNANPTRINNFFFLSLLLLLVFKDSVGERKRIVVQSFVVLSEIAEDHH